MKPAEETTVAIHRIIDRKISELGRPLTYAEFVQIALYDDSFGYYRRDRKRVGRDSGSDFFTAVSMESVFRNLVIEACVSLLAPAPACDYFFVEIGAEPGQGLFDDNGNVSKFPFGGRQTFRLGNRISLPERSVVFSNELFDAQPFHRIVFRNGAWAEIGVTIAAHALAETILPTVSEPIGSLALPDAPCDGYHLDLPLASARLLETIVHARWDGLFIAFDYGKTWRELTKATPQGTARAYHHHRQSNNLLARPGEQDLTCHVCWDWLAKILENNGFTDVRTISQEHFFIQHSRGAIEQIVMKNPGQFDPDRQRLQQLLHPANMGQKFQALTGRR